MTHKQVEKAVIKALIEHYRNAETDKYGQLGCVRQSEILRQFAPEDKEAGAQALSEIVAVSTYGGRLGTYKGFSPWHGFKDPKVEAMCKAAFQENQSRKTNVNNFY